MTSFLKTLAICWSFQSDGHLWKSDRHFFKVTTRWPKPLAKKGVKKIQILIFLPKRLEVDFCEWDDWKSLCFSNEKYKLLPLKCTYQFHDSNSNFFPFQKLWLPVNLEFYFSWLFVTGAKSYDFKSFDVSRPKKDLILPEKSVIYFIINISN